MIILRIKCERVAISVRFEVSIRVTSIAYRYLFSVRVLFLDIRQPFFAIYIYIYVCVFLVFPLFFNIYLFNANERNRGLKAIKATRTSISRTTAAAYKSNA